jgi:hypothetical protein
VTVFPGAGSIGRTFFAIAELEIKLFCQMCADTTVFLLFPVFLYTFPLIFNPELMKLSAPPPMLIP